MDSAHLCGLYFVPGDAWPAGEVRENSTLLPLKTGLHLTPPLLTHNSSWKKKKKHTAGEGHFTDRTWKMCLEGGRRKKKHNVVLESLSIHGLWWNWLTSLYFDELHIHVRSWNVWLRELKEGLCNVTFNTRGQRPCCPRHLSREAGALDCLRAFFNLVLIAAAMSSNHFTSPGPLLLWPWGREFRGKNRTIFSHFAYEQRQLESLQPLKIISSRFLALLDVHLSKWCSLFVTVIQDEPVSKAWFQCF